MINIDVSKHHSVLSFRVRQSTDFFWLLNLDGGPVIFRSVCNYLAIDMSVQEQSWWIAWPRRWRSCDVPKRLASQYVRFRALFLHCWTLKVKALQFFETSVNRHGVTSTIMNIRHYRYLEHQIPHDVTISSTHATWTCLLI